MKIGELIWSDAPLSRGTYALIGLFGCATKYGLDYEIATHVFHREWGLTHYWMPLGRTGEILTSAGSDAWFLVTMVGLALPFIWVGTLCTVRRLRDAGLPLSCVALFFLPMINLVFFLMLSAVPSRDSGRSNKSEIGASKKGSFGRLIPQSKGGSAAVAVFLPAILGLCFVILSVDILTVYGWGLFVALPFCIGFLSATIFSYHQQRDYGQTLVVSCLSSILLGGLLLVYGREGAICLMMAAPLATLLATLGGSIGYGIRRRLWVQRHQPAILSILLLVLPGIMTTEKALRPVSTEFEVKTSIDINAPPEVVWNQVVAFSEIPEPHEWIFRVGIAYPERAEIIGHGVGAERHCVFSTGSFVEPIQVWDEPRLLRFSVTSNPPPMREWSPYANIDPPHLHGFFVSDGGQFLLTPLPGGRTRLEGTTWYRHTIWPAIYWKNWSDYIIHRIHLRVLGHIDALAAGTAGK